MATPVFYQTMNNLGVDPTVYYANQATAGGSITPEYPAPPFTAGMQAIGSDGSQFIFVQASTSISLTDIVAINLGAGANANPYMANSVNSTNIWSSLLLGIGMTGLVLKNSVSFIPAGAYFWAMTKGTAPATNSATFSSFAGSTNGTNGGGPVALFVALTGVGTGILSSVSTTLTPAFGGVVITNSLTIGIAASVFPPCGTLSSVWVSTTTGGLTMGPIMSFNNPRIVMVGTTTTPVGPNSSTQTAATQGFQL